MDPTRDPATPAAWRSDAWTRALALTWLGGAVLMLLPLMMLLLASDHAEDRYPGTVILVLVVVAGWLAIRLLSRPVVHARTHSLLTSALWLLGAALIYPTQHYAQDAAYAAGVPAAVAVITLGLALLLRPAQAP